MKRQPLTPTQMLCWVSAGAFWCWKPVMPSSSWELYLLLLQLDSSEVRLNAAPLFTERALFWWRAVLSWGGECICTGSCILHRGLNCFLFCQAANSGVSGLPASQLPPEDGGRPTECSVRTADPHSAAVSTLLPWEGYSQPHNHPGTDWLSFVFCCVCVIACWKLECWTTGWQQSVQRCSWNGVCLEIGKSIALRSVYFFSCGVQITASTYKGMLFESSFPAWKAPLGANSCFCVLNLLVTWRTLWHEEMFFGWFSLLPLFLCHCLGLLSRYFWGLQEWSSYSCCRGLGWNLQNQ